MTAIDPKVKSPIGGSMEFVKLITCQYCGVLLDKDIVRRQQFDSNMRVQCYSCPVCKDNITKEVKRD